MTSHMTMTVPSLTDLVVGEMYRYRSPTGERVRFLGYTHMGFLHPEFAVTSSYFPGASILVQNEMGTQFNVGTQTQRFRLFAADST